MAKKEHSIELDVEITGRELGRGSYGKVLELNYLGLKCAGKKLHENLYKQTGNLSAYPKLRFEEECQLLSELRHPNIVQFLGVAYEKGSDIPILVLEYLPHNLTECISQFGVLPKDINYSILYDIALGLTYLHSHNPPIIHRDLTANNVLITSSMTAKISDLGVAKMLNLTPLQTSAMTQTPGTPAYMPPEVFIDKPNYGTSVDEFSFGVLMIHVLSGEWPIPKREQIQYETDGQMSPVTEAERRKEYLSLIGEEHPLMDLIEKCLNNNPGKRVPAATIVQEMKKLMPDSSALSTNRLELLHQIDSLEAEKKSLTEAKKEQKEKTRQIEDQLGKTNTQHAGQIEKLQLSHSTEVKKLQLQNISTEKQIKLAISEKELVTAENEKLKRKLEEEVGKIKEEIQMLKKNRGNYEESLAEEKKRNTLALDKERKKCNETVEEQRKEYKQKITEYQQRTEQFAEEEKKQFEKMLADERECSKQRLEEERNKCDKRIAEERKNCDERLENEKKKYEEIMKQKVSTHKKDMEQATASYEDKIDKMRCQMEETQSECMESKEELEKLKSKVDNTEREIEHLQLTVSLNEQEITTKHGFLVNSESQIAALRTALESKDSSIQELNEQLSKTRDYLSSKKQKLQVGISWKQCSDFPTPTTHGTFTIIDGKVYYGGGITGDESAKCLIYHYSPVADEWKPLPPVPVVQFGLGQIKGQLVTIGGIMPDGKVVNFVYAYNEKAKKWKRPNIPLLPTSRYEPATVSHESALLVSGGINSMRMYHNTVDVFDIKSFAWYSTNQEATSNVNSCHISPCILGDEFYLVGGFKKDRSLNKVSCATLSPENFTQDSKGSSKEQSFITWKTLAQTPTYQPSATTLLGSLLCLGGKEKPTLEANTDKKVFIYCTSSDSWVYVGDLPGPRKFAATVALSPIEFIVIGGMDENNHMQNTVYKGTIEIKP